MKAARSGRAVGGGGRVASSGEGAGGGRVGGGVGGGVASRPTCSFCEDYRVCLDVRPLRL